MRDERDYVVIGLALDLVNAGNIEPGVPALFPDRPGGFLRDDPELGHRVGGVCLDLEPDAETRLGVPDGDHLGAGVARNHGKGPVSGVTAWTSTPGTLAKPHHQGRARALGLCRAAPSAVLRVRPVLEHDRHDD